MSLPPKDPDHWLYRFSPDEWLRAARNELALGGGALADRAQRKGVAHARRAAGMALNAVLCLQPNEAWGRSYMDHLKAVADDANVSEPIRHAARQLLDAPLDGPRFIRIGGGGDEGLGAAARVLIEWCEGEVERLLGPSV